MALNLIVPISFVQGLQGCLGDVLELHLLQIRREAALGYNRRACPQPPRPSVPGAGSHVFFLFWAKSYTDV